MAAEYFCFLLNWFLRFALQKLVGSNVIFFLCYFSNLFSRWKELDPLKLERILYCPGMVDDAVVSTGVVFD